MRCHYDVFKIERDANDDVIKRAYRKLALKWHPDKNPHRVLSDPHERAFYGRYRENILARGADGDFMDEGTDLFAYLTSSCYSGFRRGIGRYDFMHEVLGEDESIFDNVKIPRDRRISIICRDLPKCSKSEDDVLKLKPLEEAA
ncbi:hypothetical protein QR680_001131 [Steinernema hermaphroditum]|uniref:J domain-containing protein n=1 Tax=Steinernema hermaphroditum TaxID=289476 RepID=A0AA39LFA7_9BILA|nr:hypothetical protein QR680_001131 [Steinernema hermaphroditum]